MSTKPITFALLTALAMVAAGCGVAEQGTSPVVVRIDTLEAANGGTTTGTFGGYLHSDVQNVVNVNNVQTPTRFNDVGRVTMSLVLRDPGSPGVANTPSELNAVTITHYRVVYRRTDGRNVQGVDVPFAFDSGMTITVSPTGQGQQTFDIVRVSAKFEAPLQALVSNGQALDTIADVTFFGKDMHNNDVAVTGSIGITFANFGG
ncbi:MAG TPA: hypothetical protein VGJ52_00230 [Vicinamibacterales bacterium]